VDETIAAMRADGSLDELVAKNNLATVDWPWSTRMTPCGSGRGTAGFRNADARP
jgi:hypothetical protein